jgi:hypothetical protein
MPITDVETEEFRNAKEAMDVKAQDQNNIHLSYPDTSVINHFAFVPVSDILHVGVGAMRHKQA